jgi:hypothetical protein
MEKNMYTMVFCRLEKAHNSTDIDALRPKMWVKGISGKMVECIKRMQDEIQCCVWRS